MEPGNIYVVVMLIWLLDAIGMMIALRVYAPRELRAAPPRRGLISLALAGGAILLYVGLFIFAVNMATAAGIRLPHPPPAVTAPGGTAASETSTAPAGTAASETSPATGSTAPGSAPVATSTEPAVNAPGESPAAPVSAIQVQLNAELVETAARVTACVGLLLLIPRLVAGSFHGMGLALRQVPRGLLLGLLAFLCAFPLLVVANFATKWVADQFHHEVYVHEIIQALERNPTPLQKTLFFCIAAVVAPLTEEFFFRGILQTALIQRGWGLFIARDQLHPQAAPPVYQRWVAILLPSVAFAYVHPSDHAAVIFLLAAALGYLYERTGNLWACMTLHTLFNSIVMVQTLMGD